MIFNDKSKWIRAKELLVTTCVDWLPVSAGGVFIRNLAYHLVFKKMGRAIYIQNGAELIGADKIEIGSESFIGRGVSIVIHHFSSRVLIEQKVVLDKGVVIEPVGEDCCIEIGEHTFIGPYTCIAGPGNIKIGKHCLIAAHSGIVANNHIFSDPIEMIDFQGVTRQGVVIGDNCWLGYGVKVLDGVTIGEGSVIGAGAVVTKDIPPYSVAVGVPAKVVRSRQLAKKQFTNGSVTRLPV